MSLFDSSSFSSLYHRLHCSVFKVQYFFVNKSHGGDEEDRTPDPLLARQVLSQLSYTPIFVGWTNFSGSLSLRLSIASLFCGSLLLRLSIAFFFEAYASLSVTANFSANRNFSPIAAYFVYAIEAKISSCAKLVGLGGLEPPTSRLSGVRSNLLSYKPFF